MTGATLALGVLTSLLAFAVLLLPPGYAALRLLGVRLPGWSGASAALATGLCVVVPLVRLESLLGGAYLVLPCVLVSLLWLRPGPAAVGALRRMWPDLLLLGLLAGYAALVTSSAIAAGPEGLSMAVGFDVSDPVFYLAVAQELGRAPLLAVQNPVFAGEPLNYSFLPELTALLLSRYTGAPLLPVVLVHLPAVALAFNGAAVLGLLEAWGATTRTARWLTALLVALGGDLSWLLPAARVGFERSAHFITFFSFSAESLLYNPWMLAVPLSLACLTLLHAGLARDRAGELGLAALVLASLWHTKVFAFAALGLGIGLYALARRPRLLGVAALAGVLTAPAVLATSLSPAVREGGPPLQLAPLYLVRTAVNEGAALHPLGEALGARSSTPGLLLVGLVFLAGGLGVRLVGLPRMLASMRRDTSGSHVVLGTSVIAALTAGLLIRGNPTTVEGVQFLLFAQALLWLYAGPTLGEWLGRAPVWRRGTAALLLLAAIASPAGYALRRTLPERLTAPGSPDRVRAVFSPETLAACQWIERKTSPLEQLMVPVARSPLEAVRPLYLAVLAGRRVTTVDNPFPIRAQPAAERLAKVRRVYETPDPREAEEILDSLGVTLVWAEEQRPLRFESDRLQLLYATGGVRVSRVRGPSDRRPGGHR